MHLIVFPFLIYTVVGIPGLLLWPQRGLSLRNYGLTVVSAMCGLVIGFGLMLALQERIHAAALFSLMFVVIPGLFAFLAVLKLGNRGRSVSKKESVISRTPSHVVVATAIAISSGFLPAALLAHALDTSAAAMIFSAAAMVPLSVLLIATLSGVIERASLSLPFKVSAVSGAVALMGSLLLLGPYFVAGLPIVLYAVTASFVFGYVLYKREQP